MIKSLLLCFAFLLLISLLHAQNLIPNSGFEEPSRIPKTKPGESKYYRAADWGWPTRTRPDFYIRGELGRFSTQRKGDNHNDEFYQGMAMAGIMGSNIPDSNQFLHVKLKSKLLKNQVYCFSINTRVPKSCTYSPSEINYTFSNYRINQRDSISGRLIVSEYNKISCYFPRGSWSTHYDTYTAKGDEEYLIIGFINPDYEIIPFSNAKESQNKMVYLFIDNLSLLPINEFVTSSPNDKCECIYFNVKPTIIKETFKPINLNFEIGKSALNPSSHLELNKLLRFLKEDTSCQLLITGHTDNAGNELINLKLSYERARSVAFYLISCGVEERRISYKGLGSQKPIKPNISNKFRLINRRVEIKIIAKGK